MKKAVWSLLTLWVILSAPLLFAAEVAKDVRPVVRIGLIAPLTGNAAHIGENVLAWQRHAVAEFSKKPTKYRYEFFVEDDALTPRNTVMAIRKLQGINRINILLTYASAPAVAAAPIAEQAHLPHLAIAFDPRATTGMKYTLAYASTAADHIPAFLKLLEKKGYKKIALVAVLNPTWKPAIDELHTAAKSGAFSIPYEKIYMPGERDFRMGMQQIPADVDAVVLLAWDPEASIIGLQFHQAGQRKPFLGFCGGIIIGTDRGSLNKGSSNIFEGAIDTYYCDIVEADKINMELTGRHMPNGGGPTVYDEIMMVVDRCESLYTPKGPPSGESIMKSFWENREHSGILGKARLGDDKFFHMSTINYYRIENNTFRKITFDEL